MNIPINYQTIYEKGKPAFAVIPYEEFLQLYPQLKEEKTIPHEVVRKIIKQDVSRIRAWREYLGLTQEELANRLNITQAALSQFQKGKTPEDIEDKIIDSDSGQEPVAVLLKKAGLVSSTSDAIRLIQQGAVRMNNELIKDKSQIIQGENLFQVGKRRFARIVIKSLS